MSQQNIFEHLNRLNLREEQFLSPHATRSTSAIRRNKDKSSGGYRQQFSIDADRILYSHAYTRYIDKTQVFSLVENDHITHRVLHVQLVARIARTIGRFLYLNEDLIEAIALGHDIGHPPFGHEGEKYLSQLSSEHGLPKFQHNIQSVRCLECLEKKGIGWNLSLQTLDGILCHDGETRIQRLFPAPLQSFAEFDQKLMDKENSPQLKTVPATLEGCVVRIADTIAYLGRDIEDAILLKVINREDIPKECRQILGSTNGTIVYTLVTDLLANSRVIPPGQVSCQQTNHSYIDFSPATAEALHLLKRFNYQRIYHSAEIKTDMPLIKECYRTLFEHYLGQLSKGVHDPLFYESAGDKPPHPLIVRDCIAGMTDDFFLKQAKQIGCITPTKRAR